jgi:hypothetical protein
VTEAVDWVEEGRRIGATLDAHHVVVVVGGDVSAVAEVALGIGRSQSGHRRVAVGDLLGDAPPLQALVPDQDAHGLVDSFLYGVSLNRVAYPVGNDGELFVMPSGTSPIDYEELFVHPRWRRLAAGFRSEGALLVLAAPSDAPNLIALIDATDGAVLVGDDVPEALTIAQSLAWVRPRRGALPPAQRAPSGLSTAPSGLPAPPRGAEARRLVAGAAGIVLTLFLAATAYWFARRPFASVSKERQGVTATSPSGTLATGGALATDSAARAAQGVRDSIARDSAAQAANLAVASDSFPVLAPANPGDSASASAYSVVLENTNGLAGAILDLRGRYATVPAGTYGRALRTRYFQLVSGAYPARTGADSLLAQLRAQRVLAPGFGSVTSLPYAFLVQANVPAAEVPARVKRRAAGSGQPVYALRQPDGTANLYFGAFESPQEAALAVPAVRKAGMTPTLVYRIGRVF